MIAFNACEKEVVYPKNPYDDVDYGGGGNATDTVNPASIVGLHRNIFTPKCNVPACHDGTFEPDFRSIQSSFSTLVYHPIVKNNTAETFTYRVVPYDISKSVLFERITNCCFVNENDRMPQDNIGTALPDQDIQNIKTWIENGAKNQNGEVASLPDLEPLFPYYIAANATYNVQYSVMSNRLDGTMISPFKLSSDIQAFNFGVFIEDDNTPVSQMQYNKLYLSTSMNDFSNPIVINATYVNFPGVGEFWLANVNVSALPVNQQIFMRYNANDGQRPNNTQFPKNSTIEPFKNYWSFIKMP
jgi:hypothetical protein